MSEAPVLHCTVVHANGDAASRIGSVLEALGARAQTFASLGDADGSSRLDASLLVIGGQAAVAWCRLAQTRISRSTYVVIALRQGALAASGVGEAVAAGADDVLFEDADDIEGRLTISLHHARRRAQEGEVERRLRAIQQQFEEFTGSVTEVLWISTADGSRNVYVSPAYEALTGMPRTEAYADPRAYLRVVVPEDIPLLEENFRPTDGPFQFEHRLTRPDGETRWAHVRGFPIRDANGRVHRVAGIITDVTERKRAETELIAQRELLRGFAQALTALLTTDPTSSIEHAIAAIGRAIGAHRVCVVHHGPRTGHLDLARTHGWYAEESARSDAAEHLPLPDTPGILPYLARIGAGEQISITLADAAPALRAHMGKRGDRSLLVVPIQVAEACWGHIAFSDRERDRVWPADVRLIAAAAAASIGSVLAKEAQVRAVHVVGERMVKQAERIASLHAIAANPTLPPLDQLQQGIAAACRALDADIVVVGRIEPSDRDACTLEHVYPVCGPLTAGERVPLNRALWEEAVRMGETFDIDDLGSLATEIREALGILWFLAVPIWVRGVPWGAIGLIGTRPRQDRLGAADREYMKLVGRWIGLLLERKLGDEERLRLEARFRDAERLESLGLLAGGIAHDFNNLLSILMIHADLAVHAAGGDGRVREQLGHVVLASKRARELTRQMLAFAGREPRRVERLDPNEIVRETAALVATSFPKDVRVDLSLDPAVPRIAADAAQIRQVVMNLLRNAAEAVGDGEGVVRVRTGLARLDDDVRAAPTLCSTEVWFRAVSADVLAPGPHVFIEVEDDGCGIPPELLTRIFDPFFTTKFTGRGLGLATTSGIVRSHRGAMDVRTTAGRGTTFRAWLPVGAVSDDVQAKPSVRSPAILRGARVLVVDDEPGVRTALKASLEYLGADVVVASDGAQAISIVVEQHRPLDLVLLDITMPKMGGVAALRALRAAVPDLPIALMSGYAAERVVPTGLGEPAPAFLAKPFTEQELIACVAPLVRPGNKRPF